MRVLSFMKATLEALIMGQVNCGEAYAGGYHTVNRRYVYAALHWCTNHHADICDTVRELMTFLGETVKADAR